MDVEVSARAKVLRRRLRQGVTMIDTQDSKSGSGNVLRTVWAVTALLTAVAGLVGALAAIAVFDGDSGVGQTIVAQQPSNDRAASDSTGSTATPETPAIDVHDVSETQSAQARSAEADRLNGEARSRSQVGRPE